MDFVKNYPSPVNREKFAEELIAAGFTSLQFRDNDFTVFNALQADEITIDALIVAHDHTVLTASQIIEAERLLFIEKATLALAFMPDLRRISNLIIDHDIASASLNTRFEALAPYIENPANISAAFYNRFAAAILEEQNLDITGVVGGILTLLPNQRRIFCVYLRIFVNQYSMLANWAE